MAVPSGNVQQCDSADGSRAQVTYLCAHTCVTCSHFVGTYTDDDLSFYRTVPPPAAQELRIESEPPAVGDAVQLVWQDMGFQCVKDGRVSRVNPADGSFAVFVGWFVPEDVRGISGALCWDGAARGVVTGVQRDTKTTHVWVQTIAPNFQVRSTGFLSL